MNDVAAAPVAAVLDTARLEGVLLIRAAVGREAASADEIGRDVAPLLAHRLPGDTLRRTIEHCLGKLREDGLIMLVAGGLVATESGAAAALRLLGGKRALPRTWHEALNIRLVARAVGAEDAPAVRLKALDHADALRALLLQQRFQMTIKGPPTPARLRQALAAVALQRAFGGAPETGPGIQPASRTTRARGLSAKAGRQLASQLMRRPCDPGTDRRLITLLAAEQAGAADGSLDALRLAVLAAFITGETGPLADAHARRPRNLRRPSGKAPKQAPARPERSVPRPSTVQPRLDLLLPLEGAGAGTTGGRPLPLHLAATAAPPGFAAAAVDAHRLGDGTGQVAAPPSRPGLDGFVAVVRALARTCAQGWSGDRKAFISDVWHSICARHPEWGLSEIEFKCMLIEAHKLNGLHLAYADLKDKNNIKELQASAIAYKNIVWHYIRVVE